MKNLCYLSLLLVAFGACKTNEYATGVNVSITNASSENFKSLEVNIQGKKFQFTDLEPNANKTVKVKSTYNYFYSKVITATDTIVFQPIDFVGEKAITSGNLDVRFEIKTVNNRRMLNLQTNKQ